MFLYGLDYTKSNCFLVQIFCIKAKKADIVGYNANDEFNIVQFHPLAGAFGTIPAFVGITQAPVLRE